MNIQNVIVSVIGVLSLLVAVLLVVISHRSNRRQLLRISKMIDEAMKGDFVEEVYDESLLSAMESKMSRYLSGSAVSAKNLQSERNKIHSLISDISHQTKTPIANILLYAQLLSEAELPMENKSMIAALASQAEKLNFLIASMVKASRLETGIITIHVKRNSLAELIRSTVEEIRPKADNKKMLLKVLSSEGEAEFDMRWMAEAIYNILDNAVKYSPEKSGIFIETRHYEAFYRLDIRDEGIGISEEEQSKIFTRFYRSQAVASCEGVGIGLYLAREIIIACGGYVKVTSQLGQGSTFSIFLPV